MNYKAEIVALKSLLADTDYNALKHADGVMSDEEYEHIRTRREEWRRLINEYEEKINMSATGRITEEQYNELMDINKEEEPKVETN